jgi:hypothetical protein
MTAALPAFLFGARDDRGDVPGAATLLLWCLWRALLDPSRRNQRCCSSRARPRSRSAQVGDPAAPLVLTVCAMAGLSVTPACCAGFCPPGSCSPRARARGRAPRRGSAGFGAYGCGRTRLPSPALHWIVYQPGTPSVGDGILLVAAVAHRRLPTPARARRSRPWSPCWCPTACCSSEAGLRLPYEAGSTAHDGHARTALLRRVAVWRARNAVSESNADRGTVARRLFWLQTSVVGAIAPDCSHRYRCSTSTPPCTPAHLDRRCRVTVLPLLPPAASRPAPARDRRAVALERPRGNKDRPPRSHRPHLLRHRLAMDRTHAGPVVYPTAHLGRPWHLAYWNPNITLVASSGPHPPRPDNATATPQSNGQLDQNAQPLTQRTVLAPPP